MSKYYEVLDISQKPDKDGYVVVFNPSTLESDRIWWYKEDDFPFPKQWQFWLREINHLPLIREQAEKVWDAAVGYTENRIMYRGDRSMFPNTPNKEEYLKQFDKQ